MKLRRQNSSVKQVHDSSLTKTMAMILGVVVVTYLPKIIYLNIAAYSVINSKDRKIIQKIGNDLL